jgi:hypothetical protein
MNRREFLGVSTVAGLHLLTGAGCANPFSKTAPNAPTTIPTETSLKLLPYPQEVTLRQGSLRLGTAKYEVTLPQSKTTTTAIASLNSHLSAATKTMRVRLGSVEEGYDPSWLTDDQNQFLANSKTSPEASILTITNKGITIVGKGKMGMLYAVQTINQLIRQAREEHRDTILCLTIRDWPDTRWRCLAPTLTWYSGWNRLEGYDICNFSEGEWKWLADWSLLHKCNAWAVCMYGYWPFTLPGYENETLNVESDWFNPTTGKKEKHRFIHRNIQREFFPEVIRYANERGIQVHAYIGKNSFNGRAFGNNAATNAGGAAEMLPFAPGVEEYWDAFIARIMDIGFNGFVFEDPEANHVPNQNADCWKTFWEPWAKTYGYKSVAETDQNNPPLGVHIEYYCWLFRTFDRLIQKHAKRLGRDREGEPEIHLISHFLLARIVNESKTPEERKKWLALVDEKHGRKVPFIIVEDKEAAYVEMFGGDRVASLGGRGGSCTNAMRRIASVNNNWCAGGMGGDLAYERNCQNRIVKAGGFGAMGYIFEWTNTEVFAYLASQHLWRNAGIPNVSNTDQTGILYYAYELYYGAEVGALVARAMDEGSCVNDAMVLEGVYGSQYPFTGKALHRDYQLLAVLADHAELLARTAYQRYTGKDPDLYAAVYDQDQFTWNDYDPAADKRFKTERLRLLWISTRRSQEMCGAALSHRLAQRLIAEAAPNEKVLEHFDRALAYAKTNQKIYQLNYDDDYDATDGLCAKVTEKLEAQRAQFIAAPKTAEPPVLFIPWIKQTDITPAPTTDLRLQTAIGFTTDDDYYRLGVVFSIETSADGGDWQTVFRKTVHRRSQTWHPCDIPLATSPSTQSLRIRFITDSYSRAMDRNTPTWNWALWQQPRLFRASEIFYDFTHRITEARPFVRLDTDGKERPFDKPGEDSTGATFRLTAEKLPPSNSPAPAIAAFIPHKDGRFGITIAQYEIHCPPYSAAPSFPNRS